MADDRKFHEIIRPEFRVTVKYEEKTKVWVSKCAALDLMSQGTTEKEAVEAIEGAVTLWARAGGLARSTDTEHEQ